MQKITSPERRSGGLRPLLLGGILPLVIYTIVEEYHGVIWGLAAAMAFGFGEILSEKISRGRVEPITWIGNILILFLGTLSLLTNEGMWFKLQPAIVEALLGVFMLGSVLVGKPFLILLAREQGMLDSIPAQKQRALNESFSSFTTRMGIFFLLHAGLALWAALRWTTRAWVLLKGVGFTGSFLVYGLIEVWWMRKQMRSL